MNDDELLEELLLEWEEARDQGQPVDLETLCRQRPHLLEPLRERVAALEYVDRLFLQGKPPTPLQAGDRLGRYELIRHVGHGGYGHVWLAQDTVLQRQVALKALPMTELDRAEGAEQRWYTEARRLARLHHDHIVAVFDAGCEEPWAYVVMAFMSGRSLVDELAQKPLSLARALDVTLKMTRALHYAHELGVVHHDVKPSNILLDARGQPYLGDFGIAALLDAPQDTDHLRGTPAYMAPEKAGRIAGPIDHRVDIYGLGLLLSRMLLTDSAFQQAMSASDAAAGLEQALLRARVPAAIRRICRRATATHPYARYPSASEMFDALQRAGRKSTNRVRVSWLVPGLALLLLVVALGLARYEPWRRTTASPLTLTPSSTTPEDASLLATVHVPGWRVTYRVFAQCYIGGLGEVLNPLADTRLTVFAGQRVTVTTEGTWLAGPKLREPTKGEYLTVAIGDRQEPPREAHSVGDEVAFTAGSTGLLFLGTNDPSFTDNYEYLTAVVEVEAADVPIAEWNERLAREDGAQSGRMVGSGGPAPLMASLAPPGGELIGLDLAMGEFSGFRKYRVIVGVRPVWRVDQSEIPGEILGEATTDVLPIRGEPGEILAGFRTIYVGRPGSVRPLWMRPFATTDRLDPSTARWGEYVGTDVTDDSFPVVGGDGRPITGLEAQVVPGLRSLGAIQAHNGPHRRAALCGHLPFGGVPFESLAEAGCHWTGVEVTLRDEDGRTAVASIQAWFHDGSQELAGPVFGQPTEERVRVDAPRGTEIGAMQVHSHNWIEGLRLRFDRVEHTSNSVPPASEWSEWLGTQSLTAPILTIPAHRLSGVRGSAADRVYALGPVGTPVQSDDD